MAIEFLKNEQKENPFLKFNLEDMISIKGYLPDCEANCDTGCDASTDYVCRCGLLLLTNPQDYAIDQLWFLSDVYARKEHRGKGYCNQMM